MIKSYGVIIAAVTELIVTVLLFIYGGRYVGRHFGSESNGTAIGAVLGSILGFTRLFIRLKKLMDEPTDKSS